MKIVVAEDFSRTPGARNPDEGPYSGEEFLEKHLAPAFERAKESGDKLIVDLDGAVGYATSFLEASFGGLARKFAEEDVLKNVEFISNDEPFLVEEISQYVKQANDQ